MPYAGPNRIVQFVPSHVEAVFIHILTEISFVFTPSENATVEKNNFTPFMFINTFYYSYFLDVIVIYFLDLILLL